MINSLRKALNPTASLHALVSLNFILYLAAIFFPSSSGTTCSSNKSDLLAIIAIIIFSSSPNVSFALLTASLSAPDAYSFATASSAAVFAAVQVYTRPVVYDEGRTEAALPSFVDGEIPVLGPQDAPDELTLLFDFQCIHCRRLHRVLPDLLEMIAGLGNPREKE